MVTKGYWKGVEEVAERLPLEGPLPREDVLTLWKWDQLKVNLLEAQGLTWRGESFKNQGWAVLLVVKVAREMTPLVAFVTERTTTDCVRVFLRQLEEVAVSWREDKFS